MSISSRSDWDRVGPRGRTRYLIVTGVLQRGLPMGALVALGVEVFAGRPLPGSLLTLRFVLTLLAGVALFSLSGCIRAASQWRLAERRFGAR